MDSTLFPEPKQGRSVFYYTDYKNCAVQEIFYEGTQCLLWVRNEDVEEIPRECIRRYEDACGVEVPNNGRGLCKDNASQ
ncbi:hypothetical protein MTO96_038249 [Rhipicephalus appendiculatus]